MRFYGLTGGIASGKSVVSQMLRSLGAEVVDADELARFVVRPGSSGLAALAARFPEAFDEGGTLDRRKLGARIFSDPEERAALDGLLHPRIREAFGERRAALEARGVSLAVYDAALLFENHLETTLDGVILVSAPAELQVARLRARNGYSAEEALARVEAQLPLAEKRKRATWVIDNSGDLASTRAQVEEVWASILDAR